MEATLVYDIYKVYIHIKFTDRGSHPSGIYYHTTPTTKGSIVLDHSSGIFKEQTREADQQDFN